MADSTVRLHESIYYVQDIFNDSGDKTYLALQKYLEVDNLFKKPVESISVGIFKVKHLSDDILVIPLDNKFKKCVCLPFKHCMVVIEILHTCNE